MLRWAMACAMALAACGSDRDEAAGGDPTGGDGGAGGDVAGSGGEGGKEIACAKNVVPLELTISPDGVADSQVIPIRYQGEDAYLAIDTGSPYTFVFGPVGAPEYIEHFGDAEIGCETFPVDQITKLEVSRGDQLYNRRPILKGAAIEAAVTTPKSLTSPLMNWMLLIARSAWPVFWMEMI